MSRLFTSFLAKGSTGHFRFFYSKNAVSRPKADAEGKRGLDAREEGGHAGGGGGGAGAGLRAMPAGPGGPPPVKCWNGKEGLSGEGTREKVGAPDRP